MFCRTLRESKSEWRQRCLFQPNTGVCLETVSTAQSDDFQLRDCLGFDEGDGDDITRAAFKAGKQPLSVLALRRRSEQRTATKAETELSTHRREMNDEWIELATEREGQGSDQSGTLWEELCEVAMRRLS